MTKNSLLHTFNQIDRSLAILLTTANGRQTEYDLSNLLSLLVYIGPVGLHHSEQVAP